MDLLDKVLALKFSIHSRNPCKVGIVLEEELLHDEVMLSNPRLYQVLVVIGTHKLLVYRFIYVVY